MRGSNKAPPGVSARLVEEHADEILRLIADGATIRQACAADPKFPRAEVFSVQTRFNPTIRARYLEVKAAWKLNRSPSGKYFGAIIALIESGMSISQACARQPELLHPDTFFNISSRHPERAARLAAALERRDSSQETRVHHQFTSAEYDAALQAIRDCSAPSVTSALKWPLPNQNTVLARCARDSAFAARYKAAMDARPDPRLHRPAAIERALDLIEANPTTPVQQLLGASKERLPSVHTLRNRVRQDQGLFERATALSLKRARARKQLHARPVYRENVLASGLAMNEYYRIASSCVSRFFEPADREDIISEMVLAMIAGEVSLQDAPSVARVFVNRFLKPQNRQRFVSLDDKVSGDDNDRVTFVDKFSTDKAESWLAA